MSDSRQPTICLNMIVRDEAEIVTQALASVAGLIDYWVIVDTGSVDSTVDVIRSFFADRGIPGEIHERDWVDFGTNRTEALELARGKADYTFVMDADDLLVGTPDFSDLSADGYLLRIGADFTYWRTLLFRGDLPWRYEGVVHEYPVCPDHSADTVRLEGDYHVESRRLGARSQVEDKYLRDAELLLAAHEEDPEDSRTVFYLAQSYMDAGEPDEAEKWYQLRVEMGGWDEETFVALLRAGQCQERMEQPWERCLQQYLAAFAFRPTRAEPLFEIARHYRESGEFALGHIFAARAQDISFPAADQLFVAADVYEWRIADELAIAAYYTERYRESFGLCCELLDNPALPDSERARVTANRNYSISHVRDDLVRYPAEIVDRIVTAVPSRGDVTVTITSCRRLDLFERTVNSFLNCCEDLDQVRRWICVDDRSSALDRQRMADLYPFFDFVLKGGEDAGHARSMNIIRDMVATRYWLHLEDDWDFFVPASYIGRSKAILADDAHIAQVLFNSNYSELPEKVVGYGGEIRHTAEGGFRYRLHEHHPTGSEAHVQFMTAMPDGESTCAYWPHYSLRPSLLDTEAVEALGPYDESGGHFEMEFADAYTAAGLKSAFFDSVHAAHTGRLTSEDRESGTPNAYALNRQTQFGHALAENPTASAESPDSTICVTLLDPPPGLESAPRSWGNVEFRTATGEADFVVAFETLDGVADPARCIAFEPAAAAADPREYLQVRSAERFPPALMLAGPAAAGGSAPMAADKSEFLCARGPESALTEHLKAAGLAVPSTDDFGPFRYAIIEEPAEINRFGPAVAEAIRAETLVFYRGCPNLGDYVDRQSFVELPADASPDESRKLIERTLDADLWGQRRGAIRAEGRRLGSAAQLVPTLGRLANGARLLEEMPTFVINLDRRPDRWETFQSEVVEAAGERFLDRCERVAAVDGRTLEMTPEIRHMFRGNDFDYRAAIVGCALSHVGLWERIAVGETPAALVFEDDVDLCRGFAGQLLEVCSELAATHHGVDVALLGWIPWPGMEADDRMASTRPTQLAPMDWSRFMGGTQAYVLSRSGAQKLLDLLERDGSQVAIDWFIWHHASELRVLMADAPIAEARSVAPGVSEDSDIQLDFREL